MKKNKHLYTRNNWLKCLLLIPLLFSFFSFSGYAEALHPRQPKMARVELTVTARSVNKKAFLFTKALKNVHQPATFASIYHALFQQLALHHDRLFNASFAAYSRQLLFFPVNRYFVQLKPFLKVQSRTFSISTKANSTAFQARHPGIHPFIQSLLLLP